jgi:hypothetical protein
MCICPLLSHFNVSFSAHVTFNEADFPFKDHPNPARFSLVDEQAGKEIRYVACGEAWGTYPSLDREQPGNPIGLRLADAHGTLWVGLSPARVCGQGPPDSMTSPRPLGKGGLVSLQASLSGEAPGRRPRFGSGGPEPLRGTGRRAVRRP